MTDMDIDMDIDTNAEARAWAAARNVPDDVPTEHWFLHGDQPIPGYAAHTEAAIRRIAHNAIVALDAREQAMGDLAEALHHVFDVDKPTFRERGEALAAARAAWQAYKEAIS